MQHWTGTHTAATASEHASFRINVVQLCRLLLQHVPIWNVAAPAASSRLRVIRTTELHALR